MVLAWWAMCTGWGKQHMPRLREHEAGGPWVGGPAEGLDCQVEERCETEGEDEGATLGFVDEAGSALGEGEHRSVCASSLEGVLPPAGLVGRAGVWRTW